MSRRRQPFRDYESFYRWLTAPDPEPAQQGSFEDLQERAKRGEELWDPIKLQQRYSAPARKGYRRR